MSTEPGGDDERPEAIESLSYRDATAELEAILVELEDDAIDIDQLSRRVRRAAALIRLCQDRIAGARLEVEHVVADLSVLAGATIDAARPASDHGGGDAGGAADATDDLDDSDDTDDSDDLDDLDDSDDLVSDGGS